MVRIYSVAIAIAFLAGLKGCATTIAEARAAAEPARVFRWAGDPEGGAPFVEADPRQPDRLVGFDVEIANLIARGLGRTPEGLRRVQGRGLLDQDVLARL